MKNTMAAALKLLNQALTFQTDKIADSYSEKAMGKIIEAKMILKNIGLKYDDINDLVIALVDDKSRQLNK